MPDHELGRYTGRLILEVLPDGRRMRLVEPFGFMDADGLHWPVPLQTIVDGASIPKPLWSLIGGPFEGKYRDASVVHDYYCDVRSADWRAVHQVFYRAMLVSGVSQQFAKLLYAAVYFAGPKWGETVVQNVRLGSPAVPTKVFEDNRLFAVLHKPTTLAASRAIERNGITALEWISPEHHFEVVDENSGITLRLDKLSEMIERDSPGLRTLENAIDEAIKFIPDVQGAPRTISVGQLTSPNWGKHV
jgi:hypothetical protein